MDEPSAALTSHEVARLFEIIRDLKQRGIGIIYIGHRLDEIFAIADRVTVLRDGANVGERPIGRVTRGELIELMVGRELNSEFPARSRAIGEPRLEVAGLRRAGAVRDVTFGVRRGEILALTGLVGAGRTETVRLIFGADKRDAGVIRLDGRLLAIRSPRDAIAAGIGLLTEDRKLRRAGARPLGAREFRFAESHLAVPWGFRPAAPRGTGVCPLGRAAADQSRQPGAAGRHLSGGNQQKVVLAKWLARNCDVLIFDEPTRGIDVGAKYEIYLLMNELAAQGKAILMISSELPEVLGMADRILVMHDGRVTGEITVPQSATQEQIMQLAIA